MRKTIGTLMLACAGQMFAGGFWLQLGKVARVAKRIAGDGDGGMAGRRFHQYTNRSPMSGFEQTEPRIRRSMAVVASLVSDAACCGLPVPRAVVRRSGGPAILPLRQQQRQARFTTTGAGRSPTSGD